MVKKLNQYQKTGLRMAVKHICENCHKHEDIVGKLQSHRVHQGGEYSIRNIQMVCDDCHKIFSSAQNRAMGIVR
jgi:hypothetical protein